MVKDVHEFPGHIACDSASRSEIVVPLVVGGECFGVFDLDSPSMARFGDAERAQVEEWVRFLMENTSADSWRKIRAAVV